ncbi:uncharacterized protein LOC144914365 isoform X2 [Branchiostoma floridae x Branchiostoma belcheri]
MESVLPAKEDGDLSKQHGKEKPTLLNLKTVDCSPYIYHTDIKKVLHGYHGTFCDEDRRLLQEVLTLVTSESRWVWKHAEIEVIGKDVHVVFCSGDKTNKFVANLDGKDCPTTNAVEKGWRLWFLDGVVKIWGKLVKEVVSNAAGSFLGQVAMKAVEHGGKALS